MNSETSTSENPVGLYYHEGSDTYAGALHPAQADAMVRIDYKLVKEGPDAAKMTEADIEAKKKAQSTEPAKTEAK